MTQFNDAMECFEWVSNFDKGRGGGLVVSVLAFYSNDPSLIPAEVYNFSVKLLVKRTKINKKRPRLAHFLKYCFCQGLVARILT